MFRKMVRSLLKLILFFLGGLLTYFIIAILLSLIPTSPQTYACPQKEKIFLATNGVHLDIIIPKELLSIELRKQLPLGGKVEYVAFGWGDRGFYLETPSWSDMRFSTAARALLFNTESVLHLTKYQSAHDSWYSIPLCEVQLEKLNSYIQQSFARDNNHLLLEIPNAGYHLNDHFFEARGNYNCINTCNIWVNRALKKAEIKTSLWSPSDKGILYHLQ